MCLRLPCPQLQPLQPYPPQLMRLQPPLQQPPTPLILAHHLMLPYLLPTRLQLILPPPLLILALLLMLPHPLLPLILLLMLPHPWRLIQVMPQPLPLPQKMTPMRRCLTKTRHRLASMLCWQSSRKRWRSPVMS